MLAKIRALKIKSRMKRNAVDTIKRYKETNVSRIEPDEGEHLLQYRQKDYRKAVSLKNAQQIFKLDLEFGKYFLDYSINGRYLALGSGMGHVSIIEWKNKKLVTEFQTQDQCRQIKFLHENFVGVAQKENLFIYDFNGLEVHQLDQIIEPLHIEYLPYHFLMVSITRRGKLFYIDCSTGETKAEIKTKIQEVR